MVKAITTIIKIIKNLFSDNLTDFSYKKTAIKINCGFLIHAFYQAIIFQAFSKSAVLVSTIFSGVVPA